MTRDVYVIGLDGVPPSLVNKGIENGDLPTFKRLRNSGVEGTTLSTIPPVSMMAWSTFATGRDPGNHGIFNFMLKERGGYDTSFASAKVLRDHSIPTWEYLDAHGIRTGVMNVMPGFPPSETAGFHISDHITTPPDKAYTHPDSIQEVVESVAEDFVLGPKTADSSLKTRNEIRAYVDQFFEIECDRVDVAKHLISEHRCQLMILVFSAPDVFLHEVGHLLDSEHPQFEEELAEELGSAPMDLLAVYDQFLSWLISLIDEDDVLMVLSDHGHGSIHTAVNLNSWLYQQGYLSLRSRPLTRLKKFGFNHLFDGAQRVLNRLGLYHAVKRRVARSSSSGESNLASLLTLSHEDIDWQNTTAFTTAGDGQVYINTTNHKHGIVGPDEYDKVREKLRSDLLNLSHPDKPGPVIEDVYDGETVYGDGSAETRPDLVCLPAPTYRIMFPQTMQTDTPFVKPQKYAGHPSAEQLEGIFYAWGTDVDDTCSNPTVQLQDYAPTIHHLLDTPIPEAMDGSARTDVFYGEASKKPQRGIYSVNEAVDKTVESILRLR